MSVEEYGDLCEQAYKDGYTDALGEIVDMREMLGRYRRAHDALILERRRLLRRISIFGAWAMLATTILLGCIAWGWLHD